MTNSDIPEPKFLSVPEAAKICGVSRNTVYMWVKQGKLGAYQTPGKTNLIRPGDLVDFMETNGMFVPASLNQMAKDDADLMGRGASGADEESAEGKGNNEPGVLVVDDDPMSRTVAVRALKDLAPVAQAETGFEALHLLTVREDIRVVLLDLRMPGQHGLETLREIHKLRSNLTVIVVSGFAMDLPEGSDLSKMVYRVMEKPISVDGLREVVESALRLQS